MAQDIDPYEVLGIAAGAGPEEVRRAFHEAVLRCHPDSNPGDLEETTRRFGQIMEAYRRLRALFLEQRRAEPDDFPPYDQFEPADFACMRAGWEGRESMKDVAPSKLDWAPNLAYEKVLEPSVDETRFFVLCWAGAILLAIGAGAAALALLTQHDSPGEGSVAVFVTAVLVTYLGLVGVAVLGIVATRKATWLLKLIGFRRQRSLPRPKDHKLTDGKESGT